MALRVDVAHHADARGDGSAERDLVERAARATLEADGLENAEVSLTVLDDRGMAELNLRWRSDDSPTDVLAFALHDEGEPPIGDIYIGRPQALRQAAEIGEPPARELARLAIHGVLHVLGWEHPVEDREESAMWKLQEEILARVDTS